MNCYTPPFWWGVFISKRKGQDEKERHPDDCQTLGN